MKLLLDAGAEIDHLPDPKRTEYSETALCSAVRSQQIAVVKLLLARGADPNAASSANRFPLHSAAWRDNLVIVQLLLEAGAGLANQEQSGARPLCNALSFGSLGLVQAVLKKGADPNLIGTHGRRPIVTALFRESGDPLPFIFSLLAANANPSLKNNDGTTAADWAGRLENREAIKLFASLGCHSSERIQDNRIILTADDTGEIIRADSFRHDSEERVTDKDKEMADRLSARPSSILSQYGWELSPKHLVILKAADRPLTLERMAYFARGYFNVASGTELDDGPKVLGETYGEAAARFVDLGLLRILSVAESVSLNATTEELCRAARSRGIKLPKKKDEMVSVFTERLPELAGEIAARKKWYCRTDKGSGAFQVPGGDPSLVDITRRLVDHLHEAALERNIEGVLLIHLDLRTLSKTPHPRHLTPRTVRDTRLTLDKAWPDDVRVDTEHLGRYRATMVVESLLPDAVFGILGWKHGSWDHFFPLSPPMDQFERVLTPGDLIRELRDE